MLPSVLMYEPALERGGGARREGAGLGERGAGLGERGVGDTLSNFTGHLYQVVLKGRGRWEWSC